MTVVYETEQRIAHIILNRPDIHNAFDDQLLSELIACIDKAENDPEIGVVILRAQGKHFSAGADIAWMQRMVNYSAQENLADSQLLANAMKHLYEMSKPTIALVQGAVYGGGNGLICCCDIAIATTNSRFCFSEVKLGLIPAVISPYVMQAIGPRMAQRYFLSAEVIDAHQAEAMQLVHQLVAYDDLYNMGINLAKHCLQHGPRALAACKDLVHEVSHAPITDTVIANTVKRIADIRVTDEAQEGLQAFLQKRHPNWMK